MVPDAMAQGAQETRAVASAGADRLVMASRATGSSGETSLVAAARGAVARGATAPAETVRALAANGAPAQEPAAAHAVSVLAASTPVVAVVRRAN